MRSIKIGVEITASIDIISSIVDNNNTGEAFIDSVSLIAKIGSPGGGISGELDLNPEIFHNVRCKTVGAGELDTQRCVFIHLCCQWLHSEWQIGSIGHPVCEMDLCGYGQIVLFVKLHFESISSHFVVNCYSDVVLVNGSFCCYCDWDLRILEWCCLGGSDCYHCVWWVHWVVPSTRLRWNCVEKVTF